MHEVIFFCSFVLTTKQDGFSPPHQHIPINVTLRRIAHGADAVAAQWDFDLLNGQGGWKSDGCHILSSDENVTTIQCTSLSNYAVLMVCEPVTFHGERFLKKIHIQRWNTSVLIASASWIVCWIWMQIQVEISLGFIRVAVTQMAYLGVILNTQGTRLHVKTSHKYTLLKLN